MIAVKFPNSSENFWAARLLSKDKDITFSQISGSLEDFFSHSPNETTVLSYFTKNPNNTLTLLYAVLDQIEIDQVILTIDPNTDRLIVEQKQGFLEYVEGELKHITNLREQPCYYKRDSG